MDRLRIMIADNHQIVREGIKLLINAQPDMKIIGEAGDSLMAISCAQSLAPDVLIMNMTTLGGKGFQAADKLNLLCPQLKVLVLTRHRNKAYLQQLVRVGAYGYVLKQSPAAELLRAIRAVGGGHRYLDPAMTSTVLAGYAGQPASIANPQIRVSQREEEVLRLIALGYGNKEIAAQLGISVKTVEAHRANAMCKLDLHSRIDIVRFALRQGCLREE